jgi:hypothetical protein
MLPCRDPLRPTMRDTIGSSGQAAVETAIVLPLNLFLLLGIIQFGMLSQARYMAKYAAYRAVRVGAMNNANPKMMQEAAALALLPVLYIPIGGSADPNTDPTSSPASPLGILAARDLGYKALSTAGRGFGLDPISVTVCGPLKGDVSGLDQSTLNGSGSNNQIDFDDPRASTEWSTGVANSSDSLKAFIHTKLRVQVQFLYIMPIPFANWIINRAFLGMSMPTILRMGADSPADRINDLRPKSVSGTALDDDAKNAYNEIVRKIWLASTGLNIYVVPIFESYSMRMQSNFFLKSNPLPDTNKCVSYGAFKTN